jgi:hypothetical protein
MIKPQLFLTILRLMLLTGWSPLPVRVDSKYRLMKNPGLILFQQVRVFIFPGSADIGDTHFGFLAIYKVFDLLLLYGMEY